MRLFIGIPVPEALERYGRSLRAEFEATQADFKWTPGENLHLTLHFLGEVPEERLDNLKEIVAAAGEAFDAFSAKTDRLGVFRDLENPKVLWLGISEGRELIGELHAFLKERLRGRFHVEERSFVPHLTLARILTKANWTAARIKLFELTRPKAVEALNVPVDRIRLYLSRPEATGSHYTTLLEVPLKKRSSR